MRPPRGYSREMSESAIPPSATPDDKDWTWTTRSPCAECGFDPSVFPSGSFPTAIREFAARVETAIMGPDATLRPDPTTWSTVEYAYHVADVCEVMSQRLDAILATAPEAARFESWDGEAVAVEKEYWRATSADVRELLRERAEAAATRFASPVGDQWKARGLRGDGVGFTAHSLGLYLLHELAHHAHDVEGSPV